MNAFTYGCFRILIVFLLITSRMLFADSVALDKNLPLPPPLSEEQLKEVNVVRCRDLLKKGELKQFYEMVSAFFTAINEKKEETISDEQKQVIRWFVYYTIAVPFVGLDTVDDVNWISYKNHLDCYAKVDAMILISKRYTLPNESVSVNERKKLQELDACYYAYMLHGFKSRYDNDSINTQRERERKGRDLMADELAFGLYNNKITTQFLINEKIKTAILLTEKGFVRMLLRYFPNKRTKILEYIKQAGYEGDEVTKLISKAVGRNKQTEFLFPKESGSRKRP